MRRPQGVPSGVCTGHKKPVQVVVSMMMMMARMIGMVTIIIVTVTMMMVITMVMNGVPIDSQKKYFFLNFKAEI